MIDKLEPRGPSSLWSDYYAAHLNYTEGAFQQKQDVLRSLVAEAKPEVVWDLGSNTGVFSRIAAEGGASVVALDFDPAVVERLYRDLVSSGETTVLPL